jgi:hypothetical protein
MPVLSPDDAVSPGSTAPASLEPNTEYCKHSSLYQNQIGYFPKDIRGALILLPRRRRQVFNMGNYSIGLNRE